MPISFNSQAKATIRTNWATPLVSYLRLSLDKRLFYLGLPSDEALDIKEWIDYLDGVCAFQCRKYPLPSDENQSRDAVIKLDYLLSEYKRKNKLQNFVVFDGYLEEVILRGFDNSPTRQTFFQKETVTIYNLDYCNSLTSPIEFVDTAGDVQIAYKFNAIKKLMEMQSSINFPSKKFLLFLTVGCSYDDRETQNFRDNPPNTDIEQYFKSFNHLGRKKAAPFILKAFVFYNLSQFFATNNFVPEFFPVIHYIGNGNHPLLFFTVAGTQVKNLPGTPNPIPTINEFLRYKFFSVENDKSFTNNQDLLANDEIDWHNTNSLDFFKNSTTIKTYWGK